jgi:hypothetical protein
MECMKRTNDLHTTQQCLMLLSKGAQLFPVSYILIKWLFAKEQSFSLSNDKIVLDIHKTV